MNPTATLSDKMLKLERERKSAREFQERKHQDWNDNYELYRNKVRTNRLTQRQAVNLPLMKETIKTILARVDEAPTINWKEKSSDELKELIYQEMWNEQFRDQKFEWKDVLDKKNVLLYGLSSKKLVPDEKGVDIGVLDTYDVVYDPLMNPLDVETARFVIHQNIFRSLREILADDKYSVEGRNALKTYAMLPFGTVSSGQNKEEYERKLERLRAMGVNHDEFPLFAAGDVVVNLCEHYTLFWNAETEQFDRHVVVYADNWCELMDEKLTDVIGVDFWPFTVWFEDPETNDIYPDGVADLVRTPNKLLNIWFSQYTENRTLRNFNMHWYAPVSGYTPQTYEPGPGRMLPAPALSGNQSISDVIQPVKVDSLDDTLTGIDFVTRIIERGTGAVAIDKGVSESGQQTLGEVEILVGKAMERSQTMQKFYRLAWYETARKWDALMHANPPGKTKLYKTSSSGKLYEKTVYPGDWKSIAGYQPEVVSSSEQETNELKTVQKFNAIVAMFPDNMILRQIAQRRNLELLDFTPDELKKVEEEEERLQTERAKAATVSEPVAQTPQPQAPQQMVPAEQGDPELEAMMGELAAL